MFAYYIARHEETLLDGLGRVQGWSNSPLTNNGGKADVHTKKSEDMKNACQKNIGLLITAMVVPAISGCTTQGSPAPDAVHQIEGGGSAVYDDDPIAVEPQLDEDELDGDSDDTNVQGGGANHGI